MSDLAGHPDSNPAVEYAIRWCRERSDRIAGLFIEARPDKTLLYIVPKSDQYDFNLGREQAKLDMFLNCNCAMGYAETRQIPSWDCDQFLSERAYRVWSSSG